MKKYEHTAQYYETDQMGCVHHSNYIRWFEEARVDMLEKLGTGYAEMERLGILSPVLGLSCDYKKMTYFGETVEITVKLTRFTGVKFACAYEITEKQTGELRCTGETRHCFLDREGKPLRLKEKFPEIYQVLIDKMAINNPH